MMQILNCLPCCLCGCKGLSFSDWGTILGIALTIVALVLYFVRPRICLCVFNEIEGGQFKIRVLVRNLNLLRTITEVECEVCITHNDFEDVKTLKLVKGKTLAIKTGYDKYVFKTSAQNPELNANPIPNYNEIRVRLLIPNVIGVKKLYEFKGEMMYPQNREEVKIGCKSFCCCFSRHY